MAVKPQNLLIILSDEHTPGAMGCAGHPVVKTPHLDRLAARGTLFRNAYCTSPICVPSRASLATGLYVSDTGYWDNAKPYEGSVPSWAHRLNHAGHRALSIGKLHYRSTSDPNGWSEERLPMHVVAGLGDLMGTVRDSRARHRKFRGYHEEAGPGESTYSLYDRNIAAEAVRWLKEEAPGHRDKPWALFVSLVCPHPPLKAPDDFYALYPPQTVPWPTDHDPGDRPEHPADRDLREFFDIATPFPEDVVRRSVAAYFGLCSFLDHHVGVLLDTVEEAGLMDSTRVLYTSDHGEMNGEKGIWGKCIMYEPSVGVPMILAGDGVPVGASVATPVSLVDVFPTVRDGVGLAAPDEDRVLRGRSLIDIAGGADGDRPAFAEFHAAGSTTASFMVRQGDLKYIHHVGYRPQLFDMATDPREKNDLGDDPTFAAERRDMEALLRAMVDPDAVNARAKADQAARLAAVGGADTALARGSFGYTPAPGEAVEYK